MFSGDPYNIFAKSERYGYLLLFAMAVKSNGLDNISFPFEVTEDELAWLRQFDHPTSPIRTSVSFDFSERDVHTDTKLYIPYARMTVTTLNSPVGIIYQRIIPKDQLPEYQDREAEKLILGDVPPFEIGKLSTVSVVMSLARACRERDYESVKKWLLHENFWVDDSLYRYSLPSRYFPGLLMNASAFIFRSAVSGRSLGIVKLLLLETHPNAFLDPSQMNNLALQDAVVSGNKEMIALIASHPNVVAPKEYLSIEKKYHLYGFSAKELDDYVINGTILGDTAETSAAIMRDPEFRNLLAQDMEYFRQTLGDDARLVRNSKLHLSLLIRFRETRNPLFAQELAVSSSFSERQQKDKW